MRRTVKKVIDGDTFETYRKVGNTNRVRIAGYNAPEYNQRGGRYAKEKLRRMISGRIITLVPKGRSYDRVVADVRYKRKKISNLMRR